MGSAARVPRWARRFVFAGVLWLLVWQLATLAGAGHRTVVVLGLLGFVFHTVFGKAYSLIPSYFDTQVTTARFVPVQFVGAVGGTALLAAGSQRSHGAASALGSGLWLLAVLVFVGTLGWSIRGNLSGARTGTGGANSHRRWLDRLANRFVPVVFLYLLAGSWAVFALETGSPAVAGVDLPAFDNPARASHLLAAGAGGLLVFALGFRMLPRFFVAEVPRILPLVVLPAGAVGPLIVALSLPAGGWFVLGALLQASALSGFAISVAVLYVRSDRRRVGFYGVLAGALAGVLAASFGLLFAFDGITAARLAAHVRLNLLGFLGLTIVGVSYQFYPPSIGSFPFAGNATAITAIGLLATGLLIEVLGVFASTGAVTAAGRSLAVAGAAVHAYLIAGLFYERTL